MDNGQKKESGYFDGVYDYVSDALSSISTFVGWSSPAAVNNSPIKQETVVLNADPEVCQTTGKPVCCCSKNKPK